MAVPYPVPPYPVPLEVAIRDRPPYLENAATLGPSLSPVLDAMGTLEERERIEADYEWFRYSKFALPLLVFNGALASVLILLSFWYGGTDYTDFRNGTPRLIEVPTTTDSLESGIPKANRSVRFACFTIGYIGLFGLILTMYIKPPPATRKLMYYFFSLVGLFICGILGAIAGGLDAGKVSNATWCRSRERGTVPTIPPSCYSMSKMAIALTVVDLSLAAVSIATALIFILAATKSFAEPKEDDFGQQKENPGVSRTTRECLLGLLAVNFLLLTLMITFTIILHEGRDVRFADETFYVRTYNNLKPGWPIKNTRLRISATSIIIGTSILNLIPFRSRVFAYVCAFVYWICANLLLVCFALDVKSLDTIRRLACPYGWTCEYGIFITVCVFDLWIVIMELLYIIFEFIARLLMECRHCTRSYGFFEIKKHENSECSSRPVRCEVCAKQMTAKEFVYDHRMTCGYNTRRCDQCGVLVEERFAGKHKSECPKWPVECTLCHTAYARESLSAHVAACRTACDACGETIPRRDLASHATECREQQITCTCGKVMPRYQYEPHRATCF